MTATVPESHRLAGLPVIWDREDDGPAEPQSPWEEERAGRLARGLEAIGVQNGQRVVVLCCDRHAEDRRVALAAAGEIGAAAVVPTDWSPSALSHVVAGHGAAGIHLACEEGVEAWRAARGTGVMIGDGVGVMWWKALECRYAGDPS